MARQVTARRRMEWTVIPNGSNTFVADAVAQVSGSVNFAGAGNTILRMLGELLISQQVALVSTEIRLITSAIGLFSAEAIAAGVASMPSPSADPNWPWLWWNSTSLVHGVGALDVTSAGIGMRRIPFDVKTKRKIRSGESLVMLSNYSEVSGSTGTVTVTAAQTRVLAALP